MGVCWHFHSDIAPIKSNKSNQIIIASSIKSLKNDNVNTGKTEEILLNGSLDESIKQFPDMPEWGDDIKKGYGIKEMPAYKCSLKIDELNKQRELFWLSKKTRKNQWKIIHQACIYDHIKANEYLVKNNFKTVNGCINMCKDEQGNIYRVPNYCINDPYYELQLLPKNNNKNKEIGVILVDSSNQKHTKLKIKESITGKELVELYAKNNYIDLTSKKILLLFGGGFIKEEETLYQHKVKNGFTIQIFIKNI